MVMKLGERRGIPSSFFVPNKTSSKGFIENPPKN